MQTKNKPGKEMKGLQKRAATMMAKIEPVRVSLAANTGKKLTPNMRNRVPSYILDAGLGGL